MTKGPAAWLNFIQPQLPLSHQCSTMLDSSSLPQGLCYTSKDNAVKILAAAFQDDCFHRYVLSTWTRYEAEQGILSTNRYFFNELLSDLEEEEGTMFLSVPESDLVMVCQLETVDSNASEQDIPAEIPSAILELNAKSSATLQRALPHRRQVLHLFLFGRRRQVQQWSSTNGREMLGRLSQWAKDQKWPIYLEATSERSRDLFVSQGFQIMEEVKLGEGLVDHLGMPRTQGEGVTVWLGLLLPGESNE